MSRKREETTDRVVEQVRQIGTETGLLPNRKWVQLAEKLNQQSIKTPRGATWTGPSIHTFVKREGLLTECVTQQAIVLAHKESGRTEEPVPQASHTIIRSGVQGTVIQHNTDQAVLAAHTAAHIPDLQDAVLASRTWDEILEGKLPSPTTPVLPGDTPSHATLDPEMVRELREMLTWWKQHREDQPMSKQRPLFNRVPSTTRSVRISKDLALDAERYAMKNTATTGRTFSGLVELLLWQLLGPVPK